jgi:6,7-dimethyl-8-ribityllumazine synthase
MPKRIAVVLGEFHKKELTQMLEETRKVAAENNLEIVEEVWVHGSIEKPLALKRLLQRDDIDGAVVLGIIEKGGTKHGFVMGQVVYQAIIDLQLEFMKPIGLGILGPGIEPDQVESRLNPYAREATIALVGML